MTRPNHNRARAIQRGRLYCGKCRKWKQPTDFAENQRKTGARKGRCKHCIELTDIQDTRTANLDDAIKLPMQRRWDLENKK